MSPESLERRISDYSQNTFVLFSAGTGDFTQASWNQGEQEMQNPFCRFGIVPSKPDSASIDSILPHREATQETLGTDLAEDYTEVYSDEEYLAAMIHNDIVISMSPVEEYSIEVIIDAVEIAKPTISKPEDLFRVGEK